MTLRDLEENICLKGNSTKFSFAFMSLITGLIAKNSHNVCGVYIITEFTLKGFEYQI